MVSRVSLAVLGGAFSFWFALPTTQAAIFNIADGDVASLASAITTANSNGEDDTINLAAKGTYTLTVANNTPPNTGANGLPLIVNDAGDLLTINGNGATITNSTISGNTAKNNAGGLSVGPGTSLTNCTITGNSAGDSGGGIFNNGAGGDSIDARNTIVALNTAPTGPDISGPLTSQGFNLVGDDSDAAITPAQDSDQIGVSAEELKLGPLQDNGGPTFTHALLPGSVAIGLEPQLRS